MRKGCPSFKSYSINHSSGIPRQSNEARRRNKMNTNEERSIKSILIHRLPDLILYRSEKLHSKIPTSHKQLQESSRIQNQLKN
jgi:hypothetical protein